MPKKLDLTDNLEKYIIDHSETLTDVQKEIIKHNISLGDQKKLQISISQAQFLQTLIKISNVKKILEIGSFTGFSALSMALALPSDGSLTSLDNNLEFSNKAKYFFEKANEKKIKQIIKPAIKSLKDLKASNQLFDLIFIDAYKEIMFTIFGFYKFKKIKFLKRYKFLLQEEIFKNNIKGTIILSSEGINGTVAGKKDNINKMIKKLKMQFKFKDFDSKNTSLSHFQPFHKGKIKIKKEVVPLGLTINSKNKKINKYISGKSWNKLISNNETLVIDARKPFEYDVGTFKNAINPKIQNFRDFPKYLKKINKTKNVAMFCTGGIRCEKASIFLNKKGFKNVFQLKGGILNYLNKTKNLLYLCWL